MRRSVGFLLAVTLGFGSVAVSAQTSGAPQGQAGSQPAASQATPPPEPTSEERRPATTTFFGDTGLWFVPTGEILPHGRWSLSGYRAGFNFEQGFSNVSHIAATFGVGVRDRLELFGSWRLDTRIDRDVRPLFGSPSDPTVGGLLNEHPYVREQWIGDNLGDLLVGAKVNLLSEHRQAPVAFAVRGLVKLPTGDRDAGASTGKADFLLDGILSKEVAGGVELSGFGGFAWRGQADDPVDVEISDGFRWGVGAGFPTRSALRVFTELHGEARFDDAVIAASPLVASDGSLSPLVSPLRSRATGTIGVVWQHRNGFFVGAGLNHDFIGSSREDRPAAGEGLDKSRLSDYTDFQIRIGYHPGARVYVAPPPPPPPTPPPPPANRPPTVRARCEPCTVEVGKSSTVTGEATDPDGDRLSYRWTAPSGSFANPAERQTPWTAPMQEGPVPVTVTVDDGKGETATDTVTIQVVRPPQKTYVFEDVHFDFDRYSLRADASRVLDEVLAALKESPDLRVEVEGHTCNIGTAEYNLALGERRAASVREYLMSRGVPTDRLSTVSYGEEKPKHDNTREETRRLNRRAALTVRLK